MALNKLTTKMTEQEARATQNQNNLHLLAAEGAIDEQTIFDELAKKTSESSGADLIGVSPIDGIEGDTAQAVLENINTKLKIPFYQIEPDVVSGATISGNVIYRGTADNGLKTYAYSFSAEGRNDGEYCIIASIIEISDVVVILQPQHIITGSHLKLAYVTISNGRFTDFQLVGDGYLINQIDDAISAHSKNSDAHKNIQKNLTDVAAEKASAALSEAQKYAESKANYTYSAAKSYTDDAVSTHNTDNNAHSNIQSRLTDYTDYAVSRHNTSTAAHEDIREKIADDISAHNTDNNAHEGPFNSLRTFVIGVNGGLSSAKDKLNLLQKYPCYEYTASGGAVQRFDDVSVIEHNIGVTVHGATDENGNSVTTPTVKVYGKNLFSLSEGESGNGFTFSGSNCKIENPTSYYYTLNSTDRIKLPKGTYTFTANVSGSIDYGSANILLFSYPVCGSTKTLLINKSEFESGTRIFTDTFTAEEAFEFYIERVSFDGRTPTSADLSIDLQLEVGDTMTDYEPYTEPQTATLPTALPAGQNGEIANTFYAVSPTMTVIASDNNNLIDTVDVTYNRDIGKAIAALTS